MIMNFRSVKKKKEQAKKTVMIFVVVVLVVLGFSGAYRWLSLGFHPFTLMFWKFKHENSLSITLKNKKHLQEELKELQVVVNQQKLEIMRLSMFRLENEKLKDILTTNESYNPITASILVKPNFTLYDALVVDAGTQDGVEEGDLVVVYGSVGIGKVRDARKHISYIELFSQSGIDSLLVHNASSTYVDALGYGNGVVSFTVPRNISVTVGDFLSLPARNGFLFGTIEKIEFDSTDPMQTVFAQSAVNINQIQYVEIIPGYEEQF